MPVGRRRGGAFLSILVVAALALAGCGADKHPNNPRPAKPLTMTASITDQKVSIAPDGVGADGRPDSKRGIGAGLVTIEVANQSDQTVSLTVDGTIQKTGAAIPPRGTGELQMELRPGEYQVKATGGAGIAPAPLIVGPERSSSQDELLLP